MTSHTEGELQKPLFPVKLLYVPLLCSKMDLTAPLTAQLQWIFFFLYFFTDVRTILSI